MQVWLKASLWTASLVLSSAAWAAEAPVSCSASMDREKIIMKLSHEEGTNLYVFNGRTANGRFLVEASYNDFDETTRKSVFMRISEKVADYTWVSTSGSLIFPAEGPINLDHMTQEIRPEGVVTSHQVSLACSKN